jgi:hypothetical protein
MVWALSLSLSHLPLHFILRAIKGKRKEKNEEKKWRQKERGKEFIGTGVKALNFNPVHV